MKKYTVEEIGTMVGLNKVDAAGFAKGLAKCGFATEDTQKTGHRGRPSFVYSMNKHGTLDLPKPSAPAVAPVA